MTDRAQKPTNLKKNAAGYMSGSTTALGDLSGEGESLQWLAMLEGAAQAARSCQSLYDVNYRNKTDEKKKGLAKFFCLGKKSASIRDNSKAPEYRSRESLFELPANEAERSSQTLKSSKEDGKKRNRFAFPFRSLQSRAGKAAALPKFSFEKILEQRQAEPKGQTKAEKRVLGEDILEEVFGKPEFDQNSNVVGSPVRLRKKEKNAPGSSKKTGSSKSRNETLPSTTASVVDAVKLFDRREESIYRPKKAKDKSQQPPRKSEPIAVPPRKVRAIDFVRPGGVEETAAVVVVEDKENFEPPVAPVDDSNDKDGFERLRKNGRSSKKLLSARDDNLPAVKSRQAEKNENKDTLRAEEGRRNNDKNAAVSIETPKIKKQTSTPILRLDSSPTRQSFKASPSLKKEPERFTVYQQRSSRMSGDSAANLIEWNTNAVYESKSVAGVVREETLKFAKGRPAGKNIKKCCLTLEWVETKTEIVRDTVRAIKTAEIRLDYDLTKAPEIAEEVVEILRNDQGAETLRVVKRVNGEEFVVVAEEERAIEEGKIVDIFDIDPAYGNASSDANENPRMIMEKLRRICKSPNMTSSSSRNSLATGSNLDTTVESYGRDSYSGIYFRNKRDVGDANVSAKLSTNSFTTSTSSPTMTSSSSSTDDRPPPIPPRKSRSSLAVKPLKDDKTEIPSKNGRAVSPTTLKAIDVHDEEDLKIVDDINLKIDDNENLKIVNDEDLKIDDDVNLKIDDDHYDSDLKKKKVPTATLR